MSADDHTLPVIQTDLGDEEESSCSPKIYVSNEEASLLKTMRSLRERSQQLKSEIEKAQDPQRAALENELQKNRSEWKVLSAHREKAYVRKMIALGHLPPEADPDR